MRHSTPQGQICKIIRHSMNQDFWQIERKGVEMNSRRKNPYPPETTVVRENLEKRIRERSARVGIIGLGDVGLPLALEMGKAGFEVTGIDIDGSKAECGNAGNS